MKETIPPPVLDDALLNLPFDHFQRYRLTTRLVDLLWPARRGKPLRILDVGGHGSSLKQFLPDAEIVVADPLSPPDVAHIQALPFRHDGYFRASGGNLPFADGEFDLVTAHDTLEHVPEPLRAAFVREMVRTSRGFIILNGPVFHPKSAELEERLLRFSRDALWWENPYLKEHVAEGLPAKEAIEQAFASEGAPFTSIPNGSLPLWLAMMALRHYLLALPHVEPLQQMIDRVYNRLISPRDFGPLCYREAYIAARQPGDAARLKPLADAVLNEAADYRAGGEEDVLTLEPLLDLMQESAGEVRYELAYFREELTKRDAEVKEIRSQLAEREADVRLKDNLLAAKEAGIAERDRQLAESQQKILAREAALHETEAQLAQIRASLGYRLLEAYRRRLRWLLPAGSRRAAPYRAALRSFDWALYRAPWRRLRGRVARGRGLVRRGRQVIEREGWRSFSAKAWRKVRSGLKGRPVPPGPLSITYDQWIEANTPSAEELEGQRRTSLVLPYRPLVSIIMPVWNPEPAFLCETLDSVRAQTYDNWELCVADGGSRDPLVRAALDEAARAEPRIRVQYLDKNEGIAGNSNVALSLASGAYVAFLDHTDRLAPEALWEVCCLLNRNPAADCVYSDHDFLSEEGRRYEPLFKPEWSPEMLLSANYAAHFCAMRKTLVDEMGGLRSETDGAQDWDLMLRLSEKTDKFFRVPKVLYHWRADSTSAVLTLENKPYARAAQDLAIQEHLDRRGLPGSVDRDYQDGLRIRWRTSGRTKVSIIIPTRHNRALLPPCLRSIARSTYKNFEIVVVDTSGWTGERESWHREMQRELPYTLVWWEKPFNYSAVNNFGAANATGQALLFLNDDTEALAPDWLEEMVGWLEQPGIGAVGAQLVSRDGSIQHGGDILGMQGFADHLFTGCEPHTWTSFGATHWYRDLTAVTGACLLLRRDLFRQLGAFNEEFKLCGSDVELCLRVRRTGQRIVCTPFARVLHHERATRGNYDVGEDCFTSYWRYQSYLYGGDPYFSPNLSIFSSRPALRHPDEPKPTAVVAPALGRDLVPYKQGAQRLEDEAAMLSEWCQVSPGEVEATLKMHEANGAPFQVRTINWFIPDFDSPFYGGMHTILRFASYFKEKHGVENRFAVVGAGSEPYLRSGIKAAFPELADSPIHIFSLTEEEINALPEADVSIATLWVTAYAVSKFRRTKRKFYMVQDFEPVFYPAGTLYALSEATYRLGLYGLCNTLTLQNIYESDYGGKALGFIPCVDTSLFHPPSGPRHADDTVVVFLYGRPGHWRNCYELAIAAIRRLKQRVRKRLRVVTAGSWVSSSDSESAYLVDNLGLLDYRETASLYRTCDVGLTLSVSKHPSYLPLELMACGALVVSNINPAGSWLLQDGDNCLLAEPTAESLAAALERAINDDELRARLTANAASGVQERHADWPSQMEKVYQYLCRPEG